MPCPGAIVLRFVPRQADQRIVVEIEIAIIARARSGLRESWRNAFAVFDAQGVTRIRDFSFVHPERIHKNNVLWFLVDEC